MGLRCAHMEALLVGIPQLIVDSRSGCTATISSTGANEFGRLLASASDGVQQLYSGGFVCVERPSLGAVDTADTGRQCTVQTQSVDVQANPAVQDACQQAQSPVSSISTQTDGGGDYFLDPKGPSPYDVANPDCAGCRGRNEG